MSEKPIVENGSTDLAIPETMQGRQLLMSAENREVIQAMAYDLFASGKGWLPDHIKTEEQARITMYYGYEIGLPPMASLMEVYVVHGRPGLQSKAMLALLRARPDLGYPEWGECNDREANLTLYVNTPDRGYVPQAFKFTMEDAQRAGIAGAMYQKYPRIMLRNRVISEAMRVTFPDLLLGVAYTPEELGAPVSVVGNEVEVDTLALAAGESVQFGDGAEYRAQKAAGLEPQPGEVDFEDSAVSGAGFDPTPDRDEVARGEIASVVGDVLETLLPPAEVPEWAQTIEVSTRKEAADAMLQIGLSKPHMKALGDYVIAEGAETGDAIWNVVSTWWAEGQLPAMLYRALVEAAGLEQPETTPYDAPAQPTEQDPFGEDGEE